MFVGLIFHSFCDLRMLVFESLGLHWGGQEVPGGIPGGSWDAKGDEGPTFNDFERIWGIPGGAFGGSFWYFVVVFESPDCKWCRGGGE